MNPKSHQKSELTLSAGPDLDRHNSCSPDDFPPYEPVPKGEFRVLIGSPLSAAEATFIGHTIAWIAFGLLVVHVIVQATR